jgi:hypothetical protein
MTLFLASVWAFWPPKLPLGMILWKNSNNSDVVDAAGLEAQ